MTATLTAPITFTTLTGKPANPGQVAVADLGVKKTGQVVVKQTNAVIATLDREPHPTRVGTTIFTAIHVDGTQVYREVYKREAMTAIVKHHNSIVTAAVPVITAVKHGPLTLRPGEVAGKDVRKAIKHPKLTNEEIYALSSYTGSGYKPMNKHVLDGDASDALPHVTGYVKHLTTAIDRSIVTAPLAVLRSFPVHTALRVFGEIGSRVGDVFTEQRFTSTTTAAYALTGFGGVEVHYHVTPGASALEVNRHPGGNHHNEYEVLMPPGQRYRILADHKVDGVRVMEMETITDELG
jgi:hypothetical protein